MKKVLINDKFQKNYKYSLTDQPGKNFAKEFKPDLTPKQMLELGVFGGIYFYDKPSEFPDDWFENALIAEDGNYNESLNLFEVKASKSLRYWEEKGWIHPDDPRGWFQWYCRYYLGRRLPEEDQRQIKRWKAMTRHIAQLKKGCFPGDLDCRKKQRQALLHWAYDARKI